MRKLYGEFGYIDFVPEPQFDIIPNTDKIDLTLTADEGKQFFVRRIDFSGNATTRDKVIRREILLDEGDIFNNRLWELSILRLNQLGYFEVLKADEAADIKRNTQTNTVDITLKVKERGKNSIGLEWRRFGNRRQLRGAQLLHQQLPGLGRDALAQLAVGHAHAQRVHRDSPSHTSWTVRCRSASRPTSRRFDYNQGREASILAGQNLIPLFNSLGSQNLLNYIQTGHGFSVSASYPLRRSFARIGHHLRLRRSPTSRRKPRAATSYFRLHQFQRNRRPERACRASAPAASCRRSPTTR